MAKSPRKRTAAAKAAVRQKTVPPPGGKNLSSYMNNPDDSDSSLTAVSDEVSDRSSIVVDADDDSYYRSIRGKARKHHGKSVGKGKSLAAYGSKNWKKYTLEQENGDDEDDDDSDSDEEPFSAAKTLPASDDSSDSESWAADDSDVDFVRLQAQKKIQKLPDARKTKPRSGSVSKPKFGRRRSQAPLPDDINFAFEFNTYDNNAIDDNDDDHSEKDDGFPQLDRLSDGEAFVEEEEDIGEEVTLPADKTPLVEQLDFNPQLVSAPFKDDDINSDEDYEFDDNELLATLQADNDLEEFDQANLSRRNNSIGSLEGDEDDFLKEEEKFLVNEFENNGFDEEPDRINSTFEDKPNRSRGYSSSEDDEEDEYDEFIDFSIPFEDSPTSGDAKTDKKKKGRKNSLSDDDDDDSYLWNYFFSSDDDSEAEQPKQMKHYKNKKKKKTAKRYPELERHIQEAMVPDVGYDSGESTDVDSNIPSSTTKLGSQKAKEVLSSKTADYRPPVLGTWIAVESKPFGIIDGLATRSLMAPSRDSRMPRKSVVDDEALELEDLLNISELDYDDENDVKIWRDFNSQKRRVPLGAFRNKSVLHAFHSDNPAIPIHYNHTSKTNSEFNQRRYSLSQHRERRSSLAAVPSKSKRRRASKVEALAEGYRPTKSGLFTEQTLVDVEETLGDDNDIMALIKGL